MTKGMTRESLPLVIIGSMILEIELVELLAHRIYLPLLHTVWIELFLAFSGWREVERFPSQLPWLADGTL